VFDNDLIEFEELGSDEENLGWSRRVVVDDEMKGAFKRAMIGEGVPLDRVILDVHSGNLFSLGGKVLVDVFGGLILIVSISGIIVYFRNKKRRALSK